MTMITIPSPASMQAYREVLREFFAGMLHKLNKNSHKKTPTTCDIPTIIKLLKGEIAEFEEQFTKDHKDENVLIELHDIANFAFLAYAALRLNGGVNTERERLINEYMAIDPIQGKAFCKKRRVGSRHRVGDEILGGERGGYIRIRFQTSQGIVFIPRSHLVWWAATGHWPVGVIDHLNGAMNDDRIENLRDTSYSENNCNSDRSKYRGLPEYVVRYAPKGHEYKVNYGKYVYHRTSQGKRIWCGYYNTPEEAATLGEQRWLEKVKTLSEEELK